LRVTKAKVVRKGEVWQPDVPDELFKRAKHVHYIVRGGVCEEAIVEVEEEGEGETDGGSEDRLDVAK